MKFSNLLVTAFVGSSDQNSRRCTRTGPLGLMAPTAVFVADQATTLVPEQTIAMSAKQLNSNNIMAFESSSASSMLLTGIREWLVPSANAAETEPPTQEEVKLLREAFATFYGLDRDLIKSEKLLSQVVEAWQRQAPDEKAGLYRVRGDCYMALLQPQNAEKDYATALGFLQGPGGDLADPEELPTALLGRARAIRSQGTSATKEQKVQAAKDYQLSLRLSSREDWDTDAENEQDGASRNPYAAWEWGSMLRSSGDITSAVNIHRLASEAFDDVGDKTHSIISQMDEGIDLASLGKSKQAEEVITGAIKNMKKVEGGDVDLLQRLIAKEGESRIALASALWDSGDRSEAESLLGTACFRLDQLEADAEKRAAAKKAVIPPERLQFSIDDQIGAGMSCSRFKNEKFLLELDWPQPLQQKVIKLQSLGK